MGSSWLSRAVVFISVLIMIVTLAWLTQIDNSDPCTQQAADIGAAVLADAVGDQDALVNRAIIVQGKCEDDSR